MNSRHFLLLTSYFVLAAAALRAGVPRRWKADVAEAGTYQTSFYRGETIDISAQLTLDGRPFAVPAGASASMFVSTNDLRDVWVWPATVTTGGLIRATWLPEYDPGASAVRGFLRVDAAGTNVNYHANFLFRLLGSPGAVPNELPMPVRVLDFSRITWTNEPWSAVASLTTNDVRAIAITRDEAIAGFTKWTAVDLPSGWKLSSVDWIGRSGKWDCYIESPIGGLYGGTTGDGLKYDCTNVTFYVYVGGEYSSDEIQFAAVRTRLRPTAAQEAAWDAKADLSDIPSTNLPPLSADATVGDLVDAMNAVIGVLHKEDDE